ncbi:MAG: aconitase X catalytic domain-containing protein [Actinomycetota bacterium]
MVRLDDRDQALIDGDQGEGVAMAMRIVVRIAEAMQAASLLDITGAHIDSCLYHGRSGIDFVERLAVGGTKVVVPTTLNVSSLDLLHPELYRGDTTVADESRQLMRGYEALGAEPTWTCAPYQRAQRPRFGEHVVWAESNAIVFANSVLGARTHRYGDFIDICAAVTGRAPAAGLHLDDARRATVVVELDGLRPELLDSDVLAPVLGYVVGAIAGNEVPAIVGLPPDQPEHRLKALGAAAASSGGVGMFHAVGSTPEAPTLDAATQGRPVRTERVGVEQLRAARDRLMPGIGLPLGAVSLGTPHYSVEEFRRFVELLDGRRVASAVAVYANTSREVWHEVQLRGWAEPLLAAGVQPVTDTCTYITPVMAPFDGVALTDSAKWAHYAPGNLGVDVAFASVEDCVESAVAGEVRSVTDHWWRP